MSTTAHEHTSADLLEDALARVSTLSLAETLEWETRNVNAGGPVGSLLLARSIAEETPAVEAVLGAAIAVHTGFDWAPEALVVIADARTTVGNLREVILVVNDAAPTALPLLIDTLGRGEIGYGAVADLVLELGDAEAAADVRALAG